VFIDAGHNSSGILLRVLTVLEGVKETFKIHGSVLASITRQLSTDKDLPVLPDGVNFPLQSRAEFDSFEKMADASFQKALVSSVKLPISIFYHIFVSKVQTQIF
jgi:hypothetical protein